MNTNFTRYKVAYINSDNELLDALEKMYLYQSHNENSHHYQLDIGECAKLLVSLKPMTGSLNLVKEQAFNGAFYKKLFDFQTWALTQHLFAHGAILEIIENNIQVDFKYSVLLSLRLSILQLKSIAQTNLRLSIKDEFTQSFLQALLIGNKHKINYKDKQIIQSMGIAHLIAISGLHIGAWYFWSLAILWLFFKCLHKLLKCILALFIYLFRPSQCLISNIFLDKLKSLYLPYYWAQIFSLLLVYFYMLLTGSSITAQRAMAMLALMILIVINSKHISLMQGLCCVVIFIILSQPIQIMNISFQLSFLSMLIIVLFLQTRYICIKEKANQNHAFISYNKINKTSYSITLINKTHIFLTRFKTYLLNYVNLQLWFFVFMLFISTVLIMPISLFSMIYNFISVIVIVFVIFPLGLLGLICILFQLPIADAILEILAHLTQIWWQIMLSIYQSLSILSDFNLAHLPIPLCFLMMICLATGLVLRHWMLCILMFLNLIAFSLLYRPDILKYPSVDSGGYISDSQQKGAFKVVVFDVSQGLSILIQTQSKYVIYDVGNAYSSGFSFYDAIVKPYLFKNNIQNVNAMIVSHEDRDHAGGFAHWLDDYVNKQIRHASLQEIIRGLNINHIMNNDFQTQLFVSHGSLTKYQQSFARALIQSNSKITMSNDDLPNLDVCHNQAWIWDGVKFEFLSTIHPNNSAQHISLKMKSNNNRSCVLKISSKYGSILLPGDIEWQSELALLKKFKDKLNSDVLIAPHHGSNSSSSDRFISAIVPKLVVYSAGQWNRYSHPSAMVERRFDKWGIEQLNTACHGQITLNFAMANEDKSLNNVAVDLADSTLRQYWHNECQ